MVKLLGLREARERQALTQRDLAELANMSISTLNRVEQGLQDARMTTLRRLAAALKVDPAELIGTPAPTEANRSENGVADGDGI